MEFKEYPTLSDLLERGGVPGVEYLLALASNTPRFQQADWELVSGAQAVTVNDVAMMLMCRGTPIPGAPSESSSPLYFIDLSADKATGLGPKVTHGGTQKPSEQAGPTAQGQA